MTTTSINMAITDPLDDLMELREQHMTLENEHLELLKKFA